MWDDLLSVCSSWRRTGRREKQRKVNQSDRDASDVGFVPNSDQRSCSQLKWRIYEARIENFSKEIPRIARIAIGKTQIGTNVNAIKTKRLDSSISDKLFISQKIYMYI